MSAWCGAARDGRLDRRRGSALLLAVPLVLAVASARAQDSQNNQDNQVNKDSQSRPDRANRPARRGAERPATPVAAPCRGETAGNGQVRAIIDGRSFQLADGREIRLAGIEVPLMPAAGEAGERVESERRAGEAARAALAAIIADRMVELRKPQDGTDRYGRILAFAHIAGDSGPSVAHELLARGFAQVAAHVGDLPCANELWQRERAAREAKLGLWGEAYYAVKGADDRAGLAAELGLFVLVEGRVASVRESGGTIYVNFGRQWSQALTVTISRRNERTFAAAGLEPRQLEGRRVRVRGFMEERSGPRIEATRAEQIEIAER